MNHLIHRFLSTNPSRARRRGKPLSPISWLLLTTVLLTVSGACRQAPRAKPGPFPSTTATKTGAQATPDTWGLEQASSALAMGGLTTAHALDAADSSPEATPTTAAAESPSTTETPADSPTDSSPSVASSPSNTEAPPASPADSSPSVASTASAATPPETPQTADDDEAQPGTASQLESWLRRAPISLRISPSEQWTLVLWQPSSPLSQTPQPPSLRLAYCLQDQDDMRPGRGPKPTLHVTLTAWRDASSARTALQRAVGPNHQETTEPCPGADDVLTDSNSSVVSTRMGDLLAVYHMWRPGQAAANLIDLVKAHVAAITKERQ